MKIMREKEVMKKIQKQNRWKWNLRLARKRSNIWKKN